MKKSALFFLIVSLSIATYVNAQISTHEKPYSFTHSIDGAPNILIKVLQSIPSLNQLNKEDSLDRVEGRIPRFGYVIKTNITATNSGTWETLPDGGKLWRLTIKSDSAIFLGLGYDKFWLPEGGKLFIYNNDKTQYIGAFTSRNNKGTKGRLRGFATELIKGNTSTLEYYQPANVKDTPIISIANVVHGYNANSVILAASVSSQTSTIPPTGFGQSNSCEININCSQGASYQDEKKAIACIFSYISGTGATGALINNTSGNRTPYLLTAKHVLDTGTTTSVTYALDNWIFYWNYEAPGCSNPTSLPTNYFTTTGCTLVASDSATDFGLVELTEDPATALSCYIPYYLGWNRSTTAPTSGVMIHHPKSDIKKITIFSNAASTNSGNVTAAPKYYVSPPNSLWQVYATEGGSEDGSSGSPYLDPSHLVVGQLSSGNNTIAACAPNVYGNYGRFDVSWNGGGTPQTRLKDWLDPGGTNATMLAGSYGYSISKVSSSCTSASYTVNNVPSGNTVSWSYIISAGNGTVSLSPSGNSVAVSSTGNIMVSLTAKITTSCDSSISLNTTAFFGAPVASLLSVTGDLNVTLQGSGQPSYYGYTYNGQSCVAPATYGITAAQYQIVGNYTSMQYGSGMACARSGQGETIVWGSAGTRMIQVRVQNACGWSDWTPATPVYVNSTGAFTVSPNPAISTLNIQPIPTVATNSLNNSISGITQVNIYNQSGVRKQQQNFSKAKKAQLNISNLPNGIYYIEIMTSDGNKEKHTISILH